MQVIGNLLRYMFAKNRQNRMRFAEVIAKKRDTVFLLTWWFILTLHCILLTFVL